MTYDTICLSGGGIKGFSFIGAIEELVKCKHINIINIKNWVGTSAGALICYLFSLNYSIEEIREFILNFDFKKLIPTIEIENIVINHGIDMGDKITLILVHFLKEKYNISNITFKQLYNLTNNKLIVIGTNFTKSKEAEFSYNMTPDMSVITAIRISISIPIIFTPVLYNDDYHIDGGLCNNFPLSYCNINTTLGIYIKQTNHNNLESILSIPMGCMAIVSDVISTKDCNKYDIIEILNFASEMINFDINMEDKQKIINLGKKSVEVYLQNYKKKPIYNMTISTQTETKNTCDMFTQTE
jgi:predicted acylesterase/phospholipase RssA